MGSKIGTSMYAYRAHGSYFVIQKYEEANKNGPPRARWKYVIGLAAPGRCVSDFRTKRAAYQAVIAYLTAPRI